MSEKSDFRTRFYARAVKNRALVTQWVEIWPRNIYPPLTHPHTLKVNEFGGPKFNRLKTLAALLGLKSCYYIPSLSLNEFQLGPGEVDYNRRLE